MMIYSIQNFRGLDCWIHSYLLAIEIRTLGFAGFDGSAAPQQPRPDPSVAGMILARTAQPPSGYIIYFSMELHPCMKIKNEPLKNLMVPSLTISLFSTDRT